MSRILPVEWEGLADMYSQPLVPMAHQPSSRNQQVEWEGLADMYPNPGFPWHISPPGPSQAISCCQGPMCESVSCSIPTLDGWGKTTLQAIPDASNQVE